MEKRYQANKETGIHDEVVQTPPPTPATSSAPPTPAPSQSNTFVPQKQNPTNQQINTGGALPQTPNYQPQGVPQQQVPQTNYPQAVPQQQGTPVQNQTNTAYQQQPTYQPVGVPAPVQGHSGKIQGILGIISGVVSLLFYPIVFGPIGIILGVFSLNKGQKALGLTAIILSSIFTVLGMLLAFYVITHPELFDIPEATAGALIYML